MYELVNESTCGFAEYYIFSKWAIACNNQAVLIWSRIGYCNANKDNIRIDNIATMEWCGVDNYIRNVNWKKIVKKNISDMF